MKPTIYSISAASPNRISIIARPRGNDWLSEEISGLSREGVEIIVSMLTKEEATELGLEQEAAECNAAGIEFVNIRIPDRSVPLDRNGFLQSVDRLAGQVKHGKHVAVHCRAGIGRSAVLATSILIRPGWDAKAAFNAVEAARGCPVPDTAEQRAWVMSDVPGAR